MTPLRDNRIQITTAFLVLVLLLMAGIPAFVSFRAVQIGNQILDQTDPLIASTGRILSLMIDQETGQRGYSITGGETFIAPYNSSRGELDPLWPAAEQQAAKVGGQTPALLNRAKQEAQTWQLEVGQPGIDLMRLGSREQAVASVASGRGKVLFDQFPGSIAALQGAAQQRRAEQSIQRKQLVENLDMVLIILVLAGLVALALLYYVATISRGSLLHVTHDEVLCSVADRGIGIPEDERARVFDQFYRASNADSTDSSGFGLGLYLSREIVLRHDGRIWIERAEGRGSIAVFSLPLTGP
ncbi:MAG: sensor histidine kinase [Dehalococcoidia bacterium]